LTEAQRLDACRNLRKIHQGLMDAQPSMPSVASLSGKLDYAPSLPEIAIASYKVTALSTLYDHQSKLTWSHR